MMIGIGIPISHNRIGIAVLLSVQGLRVAAVAQLTAFDRRKARREGADQHCSRQPKRELRGCTARLVEIRLGLCDHVIDSLLGIGLAQARPRGNQLGNIGAVGRCEIATVTEALEQHAGDLIPDLAVSGRGLTRGRDAGLGGSAGGAPQKLIDIDIGRSARYL